MSVSNIAFNKMKLWQILIIWLVPTFAWSWLPSEEEWKSLCEQPLSELDLTPLLQEPDDAFNEWLKKPMDSDGNTPIHICAQKGNLELLKKLLSKVCCPDRLAVLMTTVNDYGYTALHSAAWYGHQQCVSLLYDHGASVTAARASDGNRPMHYAVYGGAVAIISLLLRHGSPVNAVNNNGHTPLHSAAETGHAEVVSLLLMHGALVNIANKEGNMPLHRAAWRGHTKVVSLLLVHGALVNTANHAGNAPLHLAAWAGSTEAISLLLEHQASTEAVNNNGKTPLQYATQQEHGSVISELEKPTRCSPRNLQHQAAFTVWQVAGCHFEQLQALLTGLPPRLLRIVLLRLGFQDLLPEEGKDA